MRLWRPPISTASERPLWRTLSSKTSKFRKLSRLAGALSRARFQWTLKVPKVNCLNHSNNFTSRRRQKYNCLLHPLNQSISKLCDMTPIHIPRTSHDPHLRTETPCQRQTQTITCHQRQQRVLHEVPWVHCKKHPEHQITQRRVVMQEPASIQIKMQRHHVPNNIPGALLVAVAQR